MTTPPGHAPPPLPPAQQMRPEHFPTSIGRDGRVAWVVGFAAAIGFPGLAIIAASAAMLVLGILQQGKNPVARAVGRRAAVFGALSLLVTVFFFLMIFVIAPALIDAGVIADSSAWSAALMVPLAVWVVVAGPLTCVIMAIVALARPVTRERAQRVYADASR
ncbi:hypothetical protein [Brachybacterium sp. YJGR34]|uniref:hypothetical protein n=1 Tax=Brachybacterium sp. YJGR34 TaxID=2059911 RepID=UPI000E0A767B|nr:hypothetical protein [Brachybacterium sp. YJGR34]